MEQLILNTLSRGQENAITTRELAGMLGVEPRTVTQLIHDLRVHGVFICSCDRGYFLPESRADLIEFVETMKSRRHQIWLAAAPAEAFLKKGTSYE